MYSIPLDQTTISHTVVGSDFTLYHLIANLDPNQKDVDLKVIRYDNEDPESGRNISMRDGRIYINDIHSLSNLS